jgi:hypothetical protein
MITNDGKQVLSKFILGQAPAYATHIAVGCGAVPLDGNDPMPEGLEEKKNLDFEMVRVPITSRGFVEENGELKIALTAELPSEDRYQISEVGIWSSASNSLARGSDSHIIFDFNERWEIHDTSIRPIPVLNDLGTTEDLFIDTEEKIFSAPVGITSFQTVQRIERKEGPRFLNRAIFMRGDASEIIEDEETGEWSLSNDSTHIHFNSSSLGVGQNSPLDELRLAFSLIDIDNVGASGLPNFVRIFIEFYRNESSFDTGFGKAQIELDGQVFAGSRYQVVSIPLKDLITAPDFSSQQIRTARISVYIDVTNESEESVGSENHFIALDGLRIENVTTENPLYKMVGYSIVQNSLGSTANKAENTNNYVEFRFNFGVS